MKESWRCAWRDSAFRVRFLVTAPVVAAVLWIVPRFLDRVEARPGVVLADPVLRHIPATDVTWLTFVLIYGALLLAVLVLLAHPRRLVLAAQAYVLFLLFRVGLMAVTPLDPPAAMVPLVDPMVQSVGSGRVLTRDLFFSGHTATLFLLALAMPLRSLRRVGYGLTAAVALALVVQHVHYTVDVLVAPFVAYGSWRMASWLRRGNAPGWRGALPWMLAVATLAALVVGAALLGLQGTGRAAAAAAGAPRAAGARAARGHGG
jgi:hypothetical protein